MKAMLNAVRAAAALLVLLALTAICLGQDKQAMERINRHKDAAELMAALNNWGVDMQVARQMKELHSRIIADLEYAGSGGVLVVARFEKIQTESGTYRNLISGQLDYVGIGSSDFAAEITDSGNRKDKPFYVMKDGYTLDVENSTAYWFSRANGNEFAMREKPLEWLHAGVINEIVRRKQANFNWNSARSEELTRLSKIMTAKIGKENLDATVVPLLQSRSDALSQLATINAARDRVFDRIRKAKEMDDLINAVGFLYGMATTIADLAGPSPPTDTAAVTTKEEALARLEKIKNGANLEAAKLAEQLAAAKQRSLEFDLKIEAKLRENKVPTNNLPPALSPPITTP